MVKLSAALRSTVFLPVLILVVIGVGGLVALIVSNSKPDPFEGARKAADSFMNAFVNCDFTTTRKYYVLFQQNAQQALSYQQSCVKGGQATFTKQLNQSSANASTKSASYQYNLTERGYNGGIILNLQYSASQHQWQVIGLSQPLVSQKSQTTQSH